MPSPFPGMDPYLEHPILWPDVHNELIRAMRAQINTRLPAPYVARTDVRSLTDTITDEDEIAVMFPDMAVLYRDRPPIPSSERTRVGVAVAPAAARIANPVSVPVRHVTIEIRTITDDRLVTIIELLSPVNKRPGHNEYQQKREHLLSSRVHLLEIDLLRRGQRIALAQPLPTALYYVLLSRADKRPWCEVWPLQLADPLPTVPVPLLGDDPDVTLDLAAALSRAYDEAGYARSIDYAAAPFPPLPDQEAAWAETLLREKGLRPSR